MTVPNSARVYHITHVDNLPAIIGGGALLCKQLVPATGHANIAYGHIQSRRAGQTVPVGPGGSLHDYVPFYFGPRSPMLYASWKGTVPGYNGGQEPIVHLVLDIADVHAAGVPFVFTDGHAIIATSRWFTDLKDLSHVDWPLMKSQFWNDTDQHPDRSRRRQAEFLIHQRVPWRMIKRIATQTQAVADRVNELIATSSAAPHPIIKAKPDWYYS